MANFCTNCGTRVNPTDEFCSNCGARIEQPDNGITIREDGKGGLIIEAPEGTTITVSDEPPVNR